MKKLKRVSFIAPHSGNAGSDMRPFADIIKNNKKTDAEERTIRLRIDLSTSQTFAEFSYPELIRKAKGKLAGDGNDDNEDKEKGFLEEFIDKGYGYDETDPFIDNSEAYDELVPSTMSTKYGGFYINTGLLEFKESEQQKTKPRQQNQQNQQKDKSSNPLHSSIKKRPKLPSEQRIKHKSFKQVAQSTKKITDNIHTLTVPAPLAPVHQLANTKPVPQQTTTPVHQLANTKSVPQQTTTPVQLANTKPVHQLANTKPVLQQSTTPVHQLANTKPVHQLANTKSVPQQTTTPVQLTNTKPVPQQTTTPVHQLANTKSVHQLANTKSVPQPTTTPVQLTNTKPVLQQATTPVHQLANTKPVHQLANTKPVHQLSNIKPAHQQTIAPAHQQKVNSTQAHFPPPQAHQPQLQHQRNLQFQWQQKFAEFPPPIHHHFCYNPHCKMPQCKQFVRFPPV